MRLVLCLALIASPALAASPDAWEEFRQRVQTACAALVQDPGEVTIEVNPFGSESYGAALVSVATPQATDRMICIVDKVTGRTELTAPFPD
jgi:hypothetical protein